MSVDRQSILARLRAALQNVKHPRTGQSVIDNQQVQKIDVDEDAKVHIQFLLNQDDPGTLVREVRAAAEAVEGVSRVKIDVKLPSAQPQKQRPAPHSVPAPTPNDSLVKNIEYIIAVSSGKGGVGKSTVAASIAAAIAASGKRVGLLGADIYGPNIPLMFGE